jgi:ATP-binding cassette subfamily C (CFTR/MRP) protein 1
MNKFNGKINVNGSISYVSQQAWTQNASIRENILFGKDYDESLYNKVISACSLKRDFKILPGGDLTEIGERVIDIFYFYPFFNMIIVYFNSNIGK